MQVPIPLPEFVASEVTGLIVSVIIAAGVICHILKDRSYSAATSAYNSLVKLHKEAPDTYELFGRYILDSPNAKALLEKRPGLFDIYALYSFASLLKQTEKICTMTAEVQRLLSAATQKFAEMRTFVNKSPESLELILSILREPELSENSYEYMAHYKIKLAMNKTPKTEAMLDAFVDAMVYFESAKNLYDKIQPKCFFYGPKGSIELSRAKVYFRDEWYRQVNGLGVYCRELFYRSKEK